MEIGDAIHEARNALGYGRQKMADMLHVTKSTVANWERGKNSVSKNRIPYISAILGLDENDLLRMNGVTSKTIRIRQDMCAVVPSVVKTVQRLCGDCVSWIPNMKRTNGYLMGRCKALEKTTERCGWCEKGAR